MMSIVGIICILGVVGMFGFISFGHIVRFRHLSIVTSISIVDSTTSTRSTHRSDDFAEAFLICNASPQRSKNLPSGVIDIRPIDPLYMVLSVFSHYRSTMGLWDL